MAFLLLIVKSAFRNRLRTLLTAVGVAIAIVAFLFLRTFITAWQSNANATAADRLVVRNKISLTFTLPSAYLEKVRAVPGVTDVTWANWFGGIYIDERNFFAQFAVDAESYLRIYSEFLLTPEERQAFLADRTGCVVGERLAEKYNWKVGDKITLKGAIYPGDWTFTVRGIYRGAADNTDTKRMLFHWKLVDEQLEERRKNQLGTILVKVADPSQSTKVAGAIDETFANSLAETRTESEKAFQLSFLSMVSAIIDAIQVVSRVILLILALILGNTMAMTTRERTTEYAVMRAIGFRPWHIVMMVLGEGFVIAAVGVGLGVTLAPPILHFFATWFTTQVGNFLGSFTLDRYAIARAVIAGLVGGMVAAAAPARRAGKLRIVDALRRVE
jgi:putative ABC transport system permease protein